MAYGIVRVAATAATAVAAAGCNAGHRDGPDGARATAALRLWIRRDAGV